MGTVTNALQELPVGRAAVRVPAGQTGGSQSEERPARACDARPPPGNTPGGERRARPGPCGLQGWSRPGSGKGSGKRVPGQVRSVPPPGVVLVSVRTWGRHPGAQRGGHLPTTPQTLTRSVREPGRRARDQRRPWLRPAPSTLPTVASAMGVAWPPLDCGKSGAANHPSGGVMGPGESPRLRRIGAHRLEPCRGTGRPRAHW